MSSYQRIHTAELRLRPKDERIGGFATLRCRIGQHTYITGGVPSEPKATIELSVSTDMGHTVSFIDLTRDQLREAAELLRVAADAWDDQACDAAIAGAFPLADGDA